MKRNEGEGGQTKNSAGFLSSCVIKTALIRIDITHPKHLPSNSDHSSASSKFEGKMQNISRLGAIINP